MKSSLKIIGGRFRGKKISFLTCESVRPTPQRIRETLFNWLMHDIHGARCLDAFAGSGILGLEAFSRGAESVYLIEKNKATYTHLQQTIAPFATSQIMALHMDAFDFIQSTPLTFNIIFLDPPFKEFSIVSFLEHLYKKNILVPDGLVYIESGHEIIVNHEQWEHLKQKKAGNVYYGLLRKHPCSH